MKEILITLYVLTGLFLCGIIWLKLSDMEKEQVSHKGAFSFFVVVTLLIITIIRIILII